MAQKNNIYNAPYQVSPSAPAKLPDNGLPVTGEPVFKIPALPPKRKHAGGEANCKERKLLEASLPLETTTLEPAEESFVPATFIKVEPIDDDEMLPDEIVTADIVNVEKKLKNQLEEQMNLQKITGTITGDEPCNARFNSLMDLFERSRFYSNFMQDKLHLTVDGNPKNCQNKKRSIPDTKITFGESSRESTTSTNPTGSYVNTMGLSVSDRQPRLLEGGVMRDYQLDGLEWLKNLDANSISGMLADEMGLGKTVQVIALICHLIAQGIPGPYLIIAPLSAIPNWISEFQRFAPQIPTLLLHGKEQARQRLKRLFNTRRSVGDLSVHPVVVTSFQIPLAEKTFFRGKTWRYLVIDEGHRIKNHQTQLAVELNCWTSITRLILTGTPLQNNLAELWSLLNFLLPEVFNDLTIFETWFDCKELLVKGGEDKILAQEQEQHILSTMHQILAPFMLRRLKTDVELELPPKRERLVFCPLTTTQKQLYSAVLDRSINMMVAKQEPPEGSRGRPKRRCVEKRSGKSYSEAIEIDSDSDSDCEPDNDNLIVTDTEDPTYKLRIRMQQPLMALRHIVNHPYLVQMPLERDRRSGTMRVRIDEDLVRKSGKMLVLDAILAKLKQRGHKVLIFSSSTMMLDLLADFMELRGYEFCHLDGRVTLAVRQEQIRRFNSEPEAFAFLISTRAGGLGINLTAADTVILYDSDWNPQADLQAQDRCHRIGQTRPVVVYRLATEGTVDQIIIERAAAKRKLEKMIIQKNIFSTDTYGNKAQTVDLVALRTLLQSDDFEVQMHSNGYVFEDRELELLLDRSSMLGKKKKKPNVS